MITHYLPIWTKMNGNRGLAVCKRYVDYASDSDQPTCEDCRRLIAEEDDKRERARKFIERICPEAAGHYLLVKRP